MSDGRRKPDPTEGYRLSDEEILEREVERLRQEEATTPKGHHQHDEGAQRTLAELPRASETGLTAEVRKIRQLVGWLLMLVALQFSIGFAVGFYLSLVDASEKDGVLAGASAVVGVALASGFAYLIFRDPARRDGPWG